MINVDTLESEINQLIALKTEGNYWDFKAKWHDNKSDLLHDIICMSNNMANRDAYIIIGVQDKTGEILGSLDTDANRKDQNNMIGFLKDKKFAGGIRPIVYVHSMEEDKIDIIVIKNTKNTPYFLTENFQGVRKNSIYSRIGDANTDIDKSADVNVISYLWRKRFGIDLSPFEKSQHLLKDLRDWLPMGTDGIHSTDLFEYRNVWYNEKHPEFTLSYEDKRYNYGTENSVLQNIIEKIDADFFWLAALPTFGPILNNKPHNTTYHTIKLKYLTTTLYAIPMISADNDNFTRVQWKRKLITNPQDPGLSLSYCYIEKDSIDFLLDEWLSMKQETVERTKDSDVVSSLELNIPRHGRRSPYDVVPVFTDKVEHEKFMNYINNHITDFFTDITPYNHSESPNKGTKSMAQDPHYIEYLCNAGKILVDWLSRWKNLTE